MIMNPAQKHNEAADRNSFLNKVYGWMGLSLLISFVTAFLFSRTSLFMTLAQSGFTYNIVSLVVLLIEWVIIYKVGKAALNNSPMASTGLIIFSALDGATLSATVAFVPPAILLGAFFITFVVFFSMSLVGIFTKKDLTPMSRYLFGGVIALIIVSVLALFIHLPGLILGISVIGTLLFTVIVAVDTNRLCKLVNEGFSNKGLAIWGALQLYIDFINLFTFIVNIALSIFGNNN